MPSGILLVDDEELVLESYRRRLLDQFPVATACGADAALRKLDTEDAPAVVVSDLRMPGIDGLELLRRYRTKSPTTIRMVLTGYADVRTVIHAINDGEVMRVLTKPCQPEVLERALIDGLRLHRLQSEAHSIPECVVAVLSGLLELASPESLRRGIELRSLVRQVANRMNLENQWEIEFAAHLAHLGHLALPAELIGRHNSGCTLSAEDLSKVKRSRLVSSRTLRRFAILAPVAQILEASGHTGAAKCPLSGPLSDVVEVFDAVEEYELGSKQGLRPHETLDRLTKTGKYRPEVLQALTDTLQHLSILRPEEVDVSMLMTGMVVDQDVVLRNGLLLLRKGHEITSLIRESLLSFVTTGQLTGKISVLLPSATPKRALQNGIGSSLC